MWRYSVKDLYKQAKEEHKQLLPTNTPFDWWEGSYGITENDQYVFADAYDKAFLRLYASFRYNDVLFEDVEDASDSLADFQDDVYNLLVLNQKKYAELYRIFVVEDADAPFTYNYDMEEHYGVTHTEVKFTKGEQENTTGETTDTHKVAPMDTSTPFTESQDVTDQHTFTDGEREDSTETDTDEIVNTRKGNIGVQTFADIAGGFTTFWETRFKFMEEIFRDICKDLLQIGDC